jgi:hypothetical protein
MLHALNAMALVALVAQNAKRISITRSLDRVDLMGNVLLNVLLPSMEISHLIVSRNAHQDLTTMMNPDNVLVAVNLVNLLMTSSDNVSKFAQMVNSAIQTTICAKAVPPIVQNVQEMIWLPAPFAHRNSIATKIVVFLLVTKLCSPVMSPENVNLI